MTTTPTTNPVFEAAERQAIEERAAAKIAASRVRLVLSREPHGVFFAALCMRLAPHPCWELPTAWTDGARLGYNPRFVDGLPPDQILGVLVHEVLHNALAHFARRASRDPRKWNVACDLAINPLVLDAGYQLPPGGLVPGDGRYRDLPKGLSAEDYYARLPDDAGGGGGSDPGGCGETRDAADEASAKQSAAVWQVAAAQAAELARQRGALPAGLERLAGEVVHRPVNWAAVLHSFVQRTARDDYSWSRPNRRHIAAGLYLPGVSSEQLGEIVVVVDCSGSIGDRELGVFAREVEAAVQAYPCTVRVVYHDAAVARVQEWATGDGPLKLEPAGGGGTDHRPVFKWIARHANPVCVICLTDGYTCYPAAAPGVPVLWAMTTDRRPPWGETVRVQP